MVIVSNTSFVPRSVMLKKLEEMKQRKLEKEKIATEEAIKRFSRNSISSISNKSDPTERIKRSCLQEKMFAMQCQQAKRNNGELKSSNSSSSEAQNYPRRQNNVSRHKDDRIKSKQKHHQASPKSDSNRQDYQEKLKETPSPTSQRSNPLRRDNQEKSKETPQTESRSNKSTKDYQEKSKEKSSPAAPKSHLSSKDYQEYLKQKYSQTTPQSNSRPTAFSFSLPSKELSSRFTYGQSSSETESVNAKPSFTLLRDRPLENQGEKSFVNFKSSDSEAPKLLQTNSTGSTESEEGSLASAIYLYNKLKKLTIQNEAEKKEATDAVMDKADEEKPKKKKKSKNLSKKSSEDSVFLSKIDVDKRKKSNETPLHSKGPSIHEQNPIKYHQSRRSMKPIDWDNTNNTSKLPTENHASMVLNKSRESKKTFSKSDCVTSTISEESSDSTSLSNVNDDEQNDYTPLHLRGPFIGKQNPIKYHQSRGIMEPIDWDVIKNASKLSAENHAEKVLQEDKEAKGTSTKSDCLAPTLSEESSVSVSLANFNLDEQNNSNKRILHSKKSSDSEQNSIKYPQNGNAEPIDRCSVNNISTPLTENNVDLMNKNRDPKDTSTRSYDLAQALCEDSSDSECLLNSDEDKPKKCIESLLHFQGSFIGEKNPIKYYENRGKLEPIDWNKKNSKSSKPSNENRAGVVPKRNREPNELLKMYSNDKPDAAVEAKEFINFVDNTTSYQTIFETKGNLKLNPRAIDDPIRQIKRHIHDNDWNVCYLPKEMKIVFKKNIQQSSVSVTHVIDYTQCQRTSNSLPVKAMQITPKKQSKNSLIEKYGANDISNITPNIAPYFNYEDFKPVPPAKESYKKFVHDISDDMFNFEIPKTKNSSSRLIASETKKVISSNDNSKQNSPIDSDDISFARSSELNNSASVISPQKSAPRKSLKFEALKSVLGFSKSKESHQKSRSIYNIVKEQHNIDEIPKNDSKLSFDLKCIDYLNKCDIEEVANKEKPIQIEEIKLPKIKEELLKPISTRYFTKEQKMEQQFKEKENLVNLHATSSSNSENCEKVSQKIIEIKSEDVKEECPEKNCDSKPPQLIFLESSDNNSKISTDDDNSDNNDFSELNNTKSSAIIKEIESDSELDKIQEKSEPLTKQKSLTETSTVNFSQPSIDFEDIEGFDVVGDFTNHISGLENLKNLVNEGKKFFQIEDSSNSKANPADMVSKNIFKNIKVDLNELEKGVTDYCTSSIIEENEPLTKEEESTAEPGEMSKRKKKKLDWMSKVRDHFKKAEEL